MSGANAKLDRLLAAAIAVTARLDRLENDEHKMGQGYHTERLVEACRTLRLVVDAIHESPAGASVPPSTPA